MNLRSLLFVPGDSERKLAKGADTGADALVLDLEDAVDIARLPIARDMVREYLLAHDRQTQQVWVRINPLDSGLALEDLAAVVRGRPDGILLPKVFGAADIVLLDNYLSALETRDGVNPCTIGIMPVATETPTALFALGSYRGSSKRLQALTWGAEDLSAAIGASTNREPNGEYAFTYRLARSQCLLGAYAAGVAAIDTIAANFRDLDALAAEAQASRREGFTGKIAIHPDQVPIINAAFSPDADEVAYAKRVILAFEQAGGAGTVQLDGAMLDRPHLKQAQQLLARL